MMDHHTLSNSYLSATVRADGAELCSLCDADGTEMLWKADPVWPRHAPVLFPIVGRLKGDQLHHAGKSYRMTQHGFARDRRFAWLARTPTSCRLVLHDDADTRAMYPFAFRLEVAFILDDDALTQSFTVANTGKEVLPASVGAHPAFVWPLRPELAQTDHQLEFEKDEPAPVRRLQDGLLAPDAEPTPIQGRVLALDPSLFKADALILDRIASNSVRYAAPGAETIEVSWVGFRELGLWRRHGGNFLCIEPWHGMASPADWDAEFATKPGVMLIPPGDSRVCSMRIRLC